MKKFFFLASALAVLAACSNNDELPAPASSEQEPITIDLQSMSYEGVMTLLSEQTALKNVTFADGNIVKTVSELTASGSLDVNQAEQMTLNAPQKDSLDVTITPDFIAVRSIVNSKQLVYTAYADVDYQAKLTDFYANLFPATRGGEPVVTRGAQSTSMKMDASAMRELVVARYEQTGESGITGQPPVLPNNPATRGWFSNLFKKVANAFAPKAAPAPKTPTVDLYLFKEKGANPLEHEMKWQVEDAIRSLKDVEKNVKFNVYIKECDFEGGINPYYTLDGFVDWRTANYPNTNGVFVLCRWGGWSKLILGCALFDIYNVNKSAKDNSRACLVTCTNSWYWYTMAHEMGHIFGADHIDRKWWQWIVPFSRDLMDPNTGGVCNTWGLHKDATNRAIIKKNLTLK